MMADEVEKMVAAIERAAPEFDAAATALVAAVTKSAASMLEGTHFAANVDAVRREILSAAHLVCAELRSTAVRTRTGNTNIASEPEPLRPSENGHQLVYTLNPCFGGRMVRCAGCRPMRGSSYQKRCCWSRCGTSMWIT